MPDKIFLELPDELKDKHIFLKYSEYLELKEKARLNIEEFNDTDRTKYLNLVNELRKEKDGFEKIVNRLRVELDGYEKRCYELDKKHSLSLQAYNSLNSFTAEQSGKLRKKKDLSIFLLILVILLGLSTIILAITH